MSNIFRWALLLLTVSEVLILHWWSLARGNAFSLLEAGLAFLAVGALNLIAFPLARARIRAEGVALVLSRGWIIGSVLGDSGKAVDLYAAVWNPCWPAQPPGFF